MKILLAVTTLFLFTACTPTQAIHYTFGHAGPTVERQAHRVVDCETGGTWNPGAVSPTDDHGLFQINRRYHRAAFTRLTGQPWSQVYDPFWNAVYAKHLWDRQGWRPWTCQP